MNDLIYKILISIKNSQHRVSLITVNFKTYQKLIEYEDDNISSVDEQILKEMLLAIDEELGDDMFELRPQF